MRIPTIIRAPDVAAGGTLVIRGVRNVVSPNNAATVAATIRMRHSAFVSRVCRTSDTKNDVRAMRLFQERSYRAPRGLSVRWRKQGSPARAHRRPGQYK